MLLTPPHEGGFVGEFVCVGAGLGGEDLVETLGSYGEDTALENVGPVVLGEVSKRGAIDDGRGHFGGCGCQEERGVVVAYGDGGDLGVYIEKDVAVEVCDADSCQSRFTSGSMPNILVAIALGVVGHHVQAPGIEDLAQSLNGLFALWAGDCRLDNWLSGLIWEEGMLSAVCNGRCCCRSISSLWRNWCLWGYTSICTKNWGSKTSSIADERRHRGRCRCCCYWKRKDGAKCDDAAGSSKLECGETRRVTVAALPQQTVRTAQVRGYSWEERYRILYYSRAFYLLPSIQLIELHYQPALTRCYPRKSSSKRALQRLPHIRPLSKPTPVGRNWQCDPLHAAHAMHASDLLNVQTSNRGLVSGTVALLLSLSLLECIRRSGFVEITRVILWKRFDLAAEQGSAHDSHVPLALLLRDMNSS